jgi:hypothetical protein
MFYLCSINGIARRSEAALDLKTTQIYAHYSRSAHEVQMVDDAFARASADDLGEQERDPGRH